MKENNKLISIILTVYNWEKFIFETIYSVLNQTYKNFELIIINDFSKDNSENIIKSFTDNRIIYIKNNKNLNIVKSRNIWIKKSNWEYLCFLDHDDLLVNTKLERQINFLEINNEYWIVWCNVININENNDIIWKVILPENNNIIKSRMLRSPQFYCWAVLIRKKILDKIWLLNEKFIRADDYDLWLRIWIISKMHNLQDYLFKYRNHLNNTTNSNIIDMNIKSIKLCIIYKNYYPNFIKSLILWFWYLVIPRKISNYILKIIKK